MNPVSLQATVVAIGGRGVLIEGPPGIGKSSLALALIDRGAVLVGDDGVHVAARGPHIWATPHPNIRGMLEVRNVGIVTLPVAEAPLTLCIMLTPDAPRMPDGPGVRSLLGIALPALDMSPETPVLPLRVEMALKMHGLPV